MKSYLETKDLTNRNAKNGAVFSNFFMRADGGNITAVYGGIGSGKSELADIITGQKKKQKGEVYSEGSIYLITQLFSFYSDLTVDENIDFISSINNKKANNVSEIMEYTGLTRYKNILAQRIPCGMRKMLQLAVAMILDPDILIIDEPYAHLDDSMKNKFMDILNEMKLKGKTIIILTSMKDDLMACDKVYYLTEIKEGDFWHEDKELMKEELIAVSVLNPETEEDFN